MPMLRPSLTLVAIAVASLSAGAAVRFFWPDQTWFRVGAVSVTSGARLRVMEKISTDCRAAGAPELSAPAPSRARYWMNWPGGLAIGWPPAWVYSGDQSLQVASG